MFIDGEEWLDEETFNDRTRLAKRQGYPPPAERERKWSQGSSPTILIRVTGPSRPDPGDTDET